MANTRVTAWENLRTRSASYVVEVRKQPRKWVGLMVDGVPQYRDTKIEARALRRRLVSERQT